MQQCIKVLLFLILNEAQHVSWGHTAHHQEPKTAQTASAKPEAACAVLGS